MSRTRSDSKELRKLQEFGKRPEGTAPRAGAGPAINTRPCVNIESTSEILSNAENGQIPGEILWELKSSSYVTEDDKSTTSAGKANVDAVSSRDPRHFLRFDIEGTTVEALYDPGSVASFIGPRLCELLKKRMKPYSERIEGAVGQGDEIIGITDLRFTIDGHSRVLPVKGVPSLRYDLILGVDFEKLFEVDTKHTGEWSVFDSEYHNFASSKSIVNGIVSCAGLAKTTDVQKEMIEKLLDKYITYNSNAPGLTHLTQHCIDVGDALTIKQ